MATARYSIELRNIRLAAMRDALASGYLVVRNSSEEDLISWPLSAGGGTVADGVWTLDFNNTVVTATASGTAADVVIKDAALTTHVYNMTVGTAATTPTPAMVLPSLSIVSGAAYSINTMTLNHAGGDVPTPFDGWTFGADGVVSTFPSQLPAPTLASTGEVTGVT